MQFLNLTQKNPVWFRPWLFFGVSRNCPCWIKINVYKSGFTWLGQVQVQITLDWTRVKCLSTGVDCDKAFYKLPWLGLAFGLTFSAVVLSPIHGFLVIPISLWAHGSPSFHSVMSTIAYLSLVFPYGLSECGTVMVYLPSCGLVVTLAINKHTSRGFVTLSEGVGCVDCIWHGQ